MPRDARTYTGWIRTISTPSLGRLVFSTTLSPQEEAFGWLDHIAEVKDSGLDFLKTRGHTRSPHRSYRLFQAFIRQAKAFYQSAENLEHRSSPLNYYYSFLNLAKAYILVNQPQFTGRNSNHGLGFSLRGGRLSKQFLTFGRSGVFQSFYRELMGIQIRRPVQINVSNLLGYCSDIGLEYEMGKFGAYRGAPAQIAILSDRNANDHWLLVAINNFDRLEPYKKSLRQFHALMEEVNLENTHTRQLFEITAETAGRYRFFESKLRYPLARSGLVPVSKTLDHWMNATRHHLIVPPHNDDFDFILNLPMRISHQLPIKEPVALYAVIFFLGSLTRYYPEFLESLLESRDSWIIERFTKSAPGSLLLYMRNLIHGCNYAYKPR